MRVLLPSLLLILGCLSGSFGQKDLRNKVFAFPASSTTAAVVLHTSNQQPLSKLTVCLKYFTVLTRAYGLFSYATSASANDFLIIKYQPNDCSIQVGGSEVRFKVPQKENPSWEHLCVSWDSSNGLVRLWVNGEPLPRQMVKKGYTISSEASIMLGQEQDTFGGGFNINQSFVGEITEVNVFPWIMNPLYVRLSRNDVELSGSLINWKSLSYTIKNDVFVDDFLAPQNACV